MAEASWSYGLVVWIFILIKKIFFRDVIIRGSHKIPNRGSIIFVAAPHCNQFVDPVILISSCPRSIGFLMAAVSLKRRIVGFFGRMLNSIPVVRAQDHVKKCSGKIYLNNDDASGLTLFGEGSMFLDEVENFKKISKNEVAISVYHEKEQYIIPIDKVISNTKIVLKKPFDSKMGLHLQSTKIKIPFSLVPVIDQSDLYTSVFERLSKGHCIGIFPEGGSHDRAEMLPLKAGVSIMALGYLSLNPDSDLKIIPCGLNYFNAHKFRSRAVVEFGDPLEVPPEFVSDFKCGGEKKRCAIETHLKLVTEALRTVTVNVPDFETLQVVQAARRLYRPEGTHKRPDMQVELNRRFIKGYLKFRDDPRIIQLRQSINEYNNLLLAFGIKDHQVKNTKIDTYTSFFRLLIHLSVIIIFGVVSLPGFIINSPALYLISRISKSKARAAKKASSVKLSGKDVISTWKLLIALILLPLMYSFYSLALMYFSHQFNSKNVLALTLEFTLLFYFLVLISFATVRLSEMFLNSYHSIKPLILAIINPGRCIVLRQVRSTLREQVNFVVDAIGPSILNDFEHNRIIKSPKNSSLDKISSTLSPESLSADESSLHTLLNNSGDIASGRASPIFDTNMEALEGMLNQCREMMKKPKLE